MASSDSIASTPTTEEALAGILKATQQTAIQTRQATRYLRASDQFRRKVVTILVGTFLGFVLFLVLTYFKIKANYAPMINMLETAVQNGAQLAHSPFFYALCVDYPIFNVFLNGSGLANAFYYVSITQPLYDVATGAASGCSGSSPSQTGNFSGECLAWFCAGLQNQAIGGTETSTSNPSAVNLICQFLDNGIVNSLAANPGAGQCNAAMPTPCFPCACGTDQCPTSFSCASAFPSPCKEPCTVTTGANSAMAWGSAATGAFASSAPMAVMGPPGAVAAAISFAAQLILHGVTANAEQNACEVAQNVCIVNGTC